MIPFNKRVKEKAKRGFKCRMGIVTVADGVATKNVTKNMIKVMTVGIKMIGVAKLQSYIACMTKKITI